MLRRFSCSLLVTPEGLRFGLVLKDCCRDQQTAKDLTALPPSSPHAPQSSMDVTRLCLWSSEVFASETRKAVGYAFESSGRRGMIS